MTLEVNNILAKLGPVERAAVEKELRDVFNNGQNIGYEKGKAIGYEDGYDSGWADCEGTDPVDAEEFYVDDYGDPEPEW